MHPALSPFSQPKTSHQSSKLHPDPDCAVLCRCPMWRPFPSLFCNNWSCHRHSDAAARVHTLDSTCSSGIGCCVIGFVFWVMFSKMDPRKLWGWNFDQYNRMKRMMKKKRMMTTKREFDLSVAKRG